MIGLFQPSNQVDLRFPPEGFLYQGIVRVPAPDSLRLAEVVVPRELDPRDSFNDIKQPINTHQFSPSQIERFRVAGAHQPPHSTYTIVDIHEGPRLLPIAPDLDLMIPRIDRFNNLAAEGCGCFFPASHPGAERSVNIMKPEDPHVAAEVLVKIPAHAL